VTFHGLCDAYGNMSDESDAKLYGPVGTGRIRDMCLYGDKNRILQVLMNFISNSLKFTPPNGSVEVRVRCIGLEEDHRSLNRTSRNPSLQSRQTRDSQKARKKDRPPAQGMTRSSESSLLSSSTHSANGVIAQTSEPHVDPMLSINVAGTTKQIPQIATRRRSNSPPPLNTKTLMFDFEVEDTGPGIPEEQQKKIFEPFVQGDLGLSKKYAGTGLGLSICAQLANLMDGTITLKSTVGKGSTFTMSIPLRYAQERAASIASSNIRIHSSASGDIGQPIYDEMPRTPQRNEGPSDSSLQKQGLDVSRSSSIVDIPRIVGFSQPYVAKEAVAVMSHPKKGMNDLTNAESEAAKQGRKVRVLVAEDNQVNQEVVLRMLKLEDVYGEFGPN
jgi:osomolarity two-component system, sensor histidine kinase SLN1